MNLLILIEAQESQVSVDCLQSLFELIRILTNARLPHQVSFDWRSLSSVYSHLILLPGSVGFDAYQLIKLPMSDLGITGLDPELAKLSPDQGMSQAMRHGPLQAPGALEPLPHELVAGVSSAAAPGFVPVSEFRTKTCVCVRRDLLTGSVSDRKDLVSLAPTWLLDTRPAIQPYSARPKFSLGLQAWSRWVQTVLPL